MRVARNHLVIPFQLARIGVERDVAVGKKVVAGTELGVGPRLGFGNAIDDQIAVRIVRGLGPYRGAAGLPRVPVAGPAFMAKFTGTGNGPEAPFELPGFVVG